MWWWVGIIGVEVDVGRRSHFVIRIVILTDFNISSGIKSPAKQYSVVRGMFTSRSTFEKRAHILFGLIARTMSVSIRFSFRFFRHYWGDALLTIHDDATDGCHVDSVECSCLHPNIRDE